jgi:hypothetical protein
VAASPRRVGQPLGDDLSGVLGDDDLYVAGRC